MHHGGAANPVSFIWDEDDLLNEMIEGGVAARYAVVDGEVLSDKRGAYRYRFVPDPLGSVNHLLDTTPAIAATYVYWPYGEVQSHSGSDTKMQFVGALGYYTGTANRVYVRARYYRPDLGRWQTMDPIGLSRGRTDLFVYGAGRPTGLTDPSGREEMWSVCGYAHDIGVGQGHLGGVICSGGKKTPCCWPQNQPGFSRHVLGCICTCVIEHEKTHFDDITCPPREFCRPSFRLKFRWRWWLTPDIEECTGYATEAACLLRTAGAGCLDQDMLWTLGCLAELNTFLCDRCRKGRDHCRKAGMPFAPDRDCRSLSSGVY